ncbi:MAG: hypothetical protein F9K19_25845 [Rhizobiaceae bacterium]|nr:MAG: hypothetical protein F9K19_25845 [Rhizobiaceae bacterium]CAG1013650.1 hypothetical protein RHIZO_04566 [Rhizobiaceae bacterium]
MLARQTAPAAVINSTGPVRGFGIPEIALRRRSAEHPMMMFAVIVTAAFASMAAMSYQAPAVAAVPGAPAKIADVQRTTAKADRLPSSEAERACRGQAWGSETPDCLVMIAREAGKADNRIRLIAAAEPNRDAPNIF